MMNIALTLRTAKLGLEKRKSALTENIDLSKYLKSTGPFPVLNEPFSHVVIDDLFTDDVYKGLLHHFNSVIERGFSKERDDTRFHPFLDLKGDFAYDGYLYVPRLGEAPELELFPSLAWNMLFSSLFNQPTGWCTSFAYHFHSSGDRTGFVHHDYASKLFAVTDRLDNGVIYRDRGVSSQIKLNSQRRIIALLYYLGNEEWQEGDGGETGLYRSKVESAAKLVAPKNNRLLAFQISPDSLHAFQQNFKARSSIVQWFHIDEPWAKERYGFL